MNIDFIRKNIQSCKTCYNKENNPSKCLGCVTHGDDISDFILQPEIDEYLSEIVEFPYDVKRDFRAEIDQHYEDFLKQLKVKASKWDMIQWAIDNEVEFVTDITMQKYPVLNEEIEWLEKLYMNREQKGEK